MTPEASNVNEPFITAEEAADFLGLAKGTIHNRVSKGEIPFYRKDGILRFRKSELDAWLRGANVETPETRSDPDEARERVLAGEGVEEVG